MKKVIALLLLAMFCFALAGCDAGRRGNNVESYGIGPDMTIYAKDVTDVYFSYVVDEDTGIVYIMLLDGHKGGITGAYNSDGTIMTVDDLPKKRGRILRDD